MPLVSKVRRSDYLRVNHPVLFKLCVEDKVPALLEFRCNTELPFCYGMSEDGSPIPANWDAVNVEVIPLWQNGYEITAVRRQADIEDFIQIDVENPDAIEVVANTSAGLLASVFYFMIESAGKLNPEELAEIESLATYLEFGDLNRVREAIQRFSQELDHRAIFEFFRTF